MGLPGTLIEDPSGMTAADQQGAAEAAAESRRKRQEQQASGSVLAPLSGPTFRMLWLIWMAANTCMWMNDVAAAWLMTSLTTSPVLVALVQSASTLPVFFLGLPSGALADILDRRRYFIVTQFWVAAVALVLCTVVLLGWMTPHLLLALVFANGIGLAMRWPVFSALIPELVPKHHLPSAMALNAVAMNASRIIGPLVAGAIIASLGSAWVFVLNAALSVVSGFVLIRWKRKHHENPLGRERLPSAMRVGLQFVKESPRMHAVLARTVCFFLHATAIMALLPLTAQRLHGPGSDGGANTFTLLLASMGAGAIVGALFLPRLREALPRERLIQAGVSAQALATLAVAFAPHVYVAVAAMMLAGMALIATANTLGVSAQMALPNWVRARHVDLPDVHHGRHGGRRRAVGADRQPCQRAREPELRRRLRPAADAAGTAHHPRPPYRGGPEPVQGLQAPRDGRAARSRTRGGHHRVPDRPRASRRIPGPDAGKPPQPHAPGRAVLAPAAQHEPSRALHRADHRRILDRAPAPLRPCHGSRRGAARPQAGLPQGQGGAQGPALFRR
jgi:MFS family permease